MRVDGVGYNPVYPNHPVQRSLSNGSTPVMSKEQMERILFFSLYQQAGLNVKLVRIAGELYSGKTLDQLV
ncbi:hypothetical protein [Thermotoga sp. SG1]|uniref:hypothetical protein n=1 Tax=Thermotoga sp. SG1 TaxID=126739 RepID=UPI000C78F987|nr:hypothetical protein [Thermotoga sp. SG1]PLV56891.1 hypothetical protein AS006_04665 [Thermotoga sp. SG1]